jgi:hypothetical protein
MRGFWHFVPYLLNEGAYEHFAWHAAAGVVQRVWRRHRERLRRRHYRRELFLWRDTRLGLLPSDLLWVIYRYLRPAGALRGLPPKYH